MWTPRFALPSRLPAVAILGPILVSALAVALVAWANRTANEREAWVRHTDEVEYVVAALDGSATDAAFGCRGWALLGDSTERDQYRAAAASVTHQLSQLRTLTSDNPIQQRRLDTLGTALGRELGRLDRVAQLTDARQRAGAAMLLGSAADGDLAAVHRLTAALTTEEERLHAIRVAVVNRQRFLATLLLVGGVGAAILLSALMSGLLARAATREAALANDLRESNAILTRQTAELEAQAETLEEQAGELEMANLSLEEQATELEQSNEELVTTTEELAERSEAAETANRAKAEFLTRMSHELRTPLNAITGYTDLMRQGIRGALTPVQEEDLNRIHRASQHLLGLINDVLNYARIEVGRVQFAIGDVPAAAVTAEAAAMIEPLAEARGLVFSQGPTDGLVMRADRERVVQIVVNLLTNAVKFTPAGGRVKLDAAANGLRIAITVSDTGRGIPTESLEQIFDPFVQVGRSTTVGDGLGLGLTISRELARAMGGELRVESEVGRGSVFTLDLPARQPLVE
jgi:signal transduction histidine kinase